MLVSQKGVFSFIFQQTIKVIPKQTTQEFNYPLYLTKSFIRFCSTSSTTTTSISQRLQKSREVIRSLNPNVRLVAVSKFQPNESILECYSDKQLHFGENYVQELSSKAPVLPLDIKWHFIGNLQSNKCKVLAKIPNLWIIESIDSIKIADALNQACKTHRGKDLGPLNVFVQVHTSSEESKSGCQPSECVSVVDHIRKNCEQLKFCGLMTIGELGGNGENDFKKLNSCKNDVSKSLQISESDIELSMGMSADYETAIKYGSTNVRLGTTIFGPRKIKSSLENNNGLEK
eukprot:c19705_g1_i2.p1 GENE.c19705_g1_i2~~c19705_g1_i2.p1  ORF type:complete len:296 (+),score=96.18 c19705_g1_i2:25-888(+)